MAAPSSPLRVAVTLEQCWHRVPGGTARAALDLVAAIAARHDDVELVGVAAHHRRAPVEPWVPSIPVAQLALPRRALYETWHQMGWPGVERATGPVDVIHVTGIAMPPRTAPIVATLHDLAFRRNPAQFTRHGLRFFEAALTRMRRDAAVVLCSSEATSADALDAGFAPDRLRVVPLGVRPVTVSAAEITAARKRFGLPERYVLHVGTAEPRKNRSALLAAARALPDDVGVVLVGAAGWGAAPNGHAEVSPARVHDLGFLAEADRCAVLGGAALFCFPSLWEGFGLPVLEAMAQGVPVVTSSGSSMAEVVGDAALLVEPTDVDALGEAMVRLLEDEALAARLRAAGPTRAAAYPWERTAALTVEAYREVAG